jgi:hypothetical protein
MCTPKRIAEAMASKGEGDMDALRQLMKEAFLLEMERKRQIGEAMLSGKMVRLATHRQD